MKISGFTFVYNALEGGYPIVEAIKAVEPYVDEVVVLDCQSNDGTREVLEGLSVRILDGEWSSEAGTTLNLALARNAECRGDAVIHFEADEVYEDRLLVNIKSALEEGHRDVAVYRIQVEQNFQRIRWYPERPVHRVFPPGTVRKVNNSTDRHDDAVVLGPEQGLLWDCANCFRDNWRQRAQNLGRLFGVGARVRAVPYHFLGKAELSPAEAETLLKQEHWTWTETPLAIPDVLRPLVGVVKYKPRSGWRE